MLFEPIALLVYVVVSAIPLVAVALIAYELYREYRYGPVVYREAVAEPRFDDDCDCCGNPGVQTINGVRVCGPCKRELFP